MNNSLTKTCLSIGYPIKSSRSPSLHNIGYKALGIEDQFIYLRAEVLPENLKMAIDGVKGFGFRGVSVTMPHKQEVMKYLDGIDEDAKKIGAVNTVVNNEGKLTGYNTDWVGAIKALEQKTSLGGRRVAVLGGGGAARAIIYGLMKRGAIVKIYNRSADKALELAKEFCCEYSPVDQVSEVKDMDIIINATSVGMNEEKSPLDKKYFSGSQIVLDAVYSPKETVFLREAKEAGAEIVYGYEMLLYQGVEQFKLYTGLDAPIEEMRKFLEEK